MKHELIDIRSLSSVVRSSKLSNSWKTSVRCKTDRPSHGRALIILGSVTNDYGDKNMYISANELRLFSSIGDEAVGVNLEKPQIFNLLCHYLVTVFYSDGQQPWSCKEKIYTKEDIHIRKEFKLPQDWFGAPTLLLWDNAKTTLFRLRWTRTSLSNVSIYHTSE